MCPTSVVKAARIPEVEAVDFAAPDPFLLLHRKGRWLHVGGDRAPANPRGHLHSRSRGTAEVSLAPAFHSLSFSGVTHNLRQEGWLGFGIRPGFESYLSYFITVSS